MFSHPLHRSVLKQIMLLPSSSLRTLEVNSDLTISSAANILYTFIHSIGMRRPSTTNMAAPHTSSPKLRAIHPPSQILQEKSRSILANRDNLLNSHALAVSQPVSLSPSPRTSKSSIIYSYHDAFGRRADQPTSLAGQRNKAIAPYRYVRVWQALLFIALRINLVFFVFPSTY